LNGGVGHLARRFEERITVPRIYAIGDIHGHLDKLRAVHALIARDLRDHPAEYVICHVGDLVDRGPDSAGVVGWLIAGQNRGEPWVVLKGNHDRMMAWYLRETLLRDHCLRVDYSWTSPQLGGLTTLASYGVDIDTDADDLHAAGRARVPVEHLSYLAKLDTVFTTNEVAFVHAGIRPGVPLDKQTEDDLVWIRRDFHDDTRDHGRLIVHGHTPVEAVTHYGNRVNIDTGAAYGRPLSVIVVEGRQVWTLDDSGRRPLLPFMA